jgi:hypothetical protein
MSLIKSFPATIELTQGPLLQIFPVPTILDRTDVVQDYKVISIVAGEAWEVALTVKNNDALVDLSTPALTVTKMRISVWDEETVTPVDIAITTEASSDLANGLIVFKCPKDAIDPLWANDFDRIPAGRIVIDFQLENSEGPVYFYDRINIIDSEYGGTGNVAPNSKNYLEAADVKSRALVAAAYSAPTADADLAQKKYVDDQVATIDLAAHEADLANPHVVTAAQVGNTTAQWNANQIEGITTALSAISNGEIVGYNGTNFVPVAASGLPTGTTGDILVNNAGTWEKLLPGASGTLLKSTGSLSLPTWDVIAGSGDMVGPASAVDGSIPSYDGVTGKLLDDSGVIAAEVVQRGDVIATAVDEIQLGVKGASGQTADIFVIQDSAAALLGGFDKDGYVFADVHRVEDHVLLDEVAAPSTPVTGKVAMYTKSDGKLYIKDDAGLETDCTGSGGASLPVVDTTSLVEGSVDATKEMRIDVGGLTTATVRVATMPDADITLGTDADALHDNVAGEIAAITNKATPVNGDLILIEDSADSNNKKHVLASNFLAGSGDVSASANITDNAIVRGDGGSKGVQESGILIDDSDNILFPNNTAIQMDDFAGSPEDVLKLNASDVLQLSSPGSISVLVNSSEALKLDTAGAFTVRNNVLFEGNVELNERSTPSTPGSGKCREYLSSSTGNREIKFDDGSVATIAYKGIDPQTVVAAGNDNDQTGTTYILVLTDQENTTVWMNNASANTLTIPTNASVAFAVGTKINVSMEGAGVTTISGDTGVTVNGTSGGSVVINNQYQGATLTKRASDTWIIQGDIT